MTVNEEYQDAFLIERLRGEDLDALGALFDRYYAQVYRTAYAITRDSAAADDIAQDCFLKLHQYVHRIDTSLPLAPWLYRVTVNLSYTWLTRRQKRRISLETLVDHLMSPSWHGPEQVAEYSETQQHVRQAISELHFNQRVVIVLHYLSGLNLDEIAEILDCPVGTVKSRLYYARENLRHRLESTHHNIQEISHGFAGVAG